MDYVERRLEGHPKVEFIALPMIGQLRNWLKEPSRKERMAKPFAIPSPPQLELSPMTEASHGEIAGVVRTHRVGPNESIRSISEAARLARDGDIVEIQAGKYYGDVATWNQKKLTIRGIGGNARLFANGKSAEGKAIWVIRNGTYRIENVDFIGARVSDKNGAGIRLENGELTLVNCLFYGNENGLLTTNSATKLEIYNSEFAYNGAGDGQSHNLYVGKIQNLKISGSYFHHANVGHLIKTRANFNEITYNRLTDEDGGRASYELEFPNGGVALVMGNIIQQVRDTENSAIISYGAEGYSWHENKLFIANNTIVNDHPYGGALLRVASGVQQIVSSNNLLVGAGKYHTPNILQVFNDIRTKWDVFIHASRQDYRLNNAGQLLPYAPFISDEKKAISLEPTNEYFHPRQTSKLKDTPSHPGARQTNTHP